MIKITNKEQLDIFLKSISKNATEKARQSLFENLDPYIDKFENELKDEMEELQEQEEAEEEPPDEDAPDEEPAEEPAEEPDEEQDEEPDEEPDDDEEKRNPAAEKALNLIDYEEDFDISFENVITALNTLRAGKSTKNKEIKTELNDYYDRLSEEERGVLLLYLNELSKVLTGAVDGDEAQDPSEPSTYFNIRKRSKSEPDPDAETGLEDKGSEISEPEEKINQQQQEKPQQQKGLEDTTPPIKVNESQDLRHVYRKFKQINS